MLNIPEYTLPSNLNIRTHNAKLYGFSSSAAIKLIKQLRLRWTGHVVCMAE
jgi:hypothetical protein